MAEQSDLDEVEAFWDRQESQVVAACRRMWAAVADEDERTRETMRQSIERTLSGIEDAADAAIGGTVLARRSGDEAGISWEQAKRDLEL
ncbi:hypothetical protein AWW66_09235 [Micromonospora rosaria]|uniref:Uncharacterized protein n=1 Tax=Micromonospora rosaria TaxID=47874 RepID=A0A136PUV8_9ACTN|nr:hypothetical protein AWW66_09235 [Micromonospora rosaria]